ncbi:hypothetical protein GWK47_019029 [Chionoecetes opilio]|uniref:Uncharacterized protein n=1 Tax=Chionoecetes opilio TaxID=41210 RepID=A0A8J5CIB8_CHIOP|nr:hypothetical protein GWK47_019029 [Chionoecetes opilio]
MPTFNAMTPTPGMCSPSCTASYFEAPDFTRQRRRLTAWSGLSFQLPSRSPIGGKARQQIGVFPPPSYTPPSVHGRISLGVSRDFYSPRQIQDGPLAQGRPGGDEGQVTAIRDFAIPANLTDLCYSWALVNQRSEFPQPTPLPPSHFPPYRGCAQSPPKPLRTSCPLSQINQRSSSSHPILASRRRRTIRKLRAAAARDPSYTPLRDCVTSGSPPNPGYTLHGQKICGSCTHPRRPCWAARQSEGSRHERGRRDCLWAGIVRNTTPFKPASLQILRPVTTGTPSVDDPPPAFHPSPPDFFSVAGEIFLGFRGQNSGGLWASPFGPIYPHATIRSLSVLPGIGVPGPSRSDGGPQIYQHDFRNFMGRWGVHHAGLRPLPPV